MKEKRRKYIIGLIVFFIVIGLFYYYMPEPIATGLMFVIIFICISYLR